nr:MAG TPA: apolipoprotein [Caudoviricetes sp.]
MDFKTGKIIEIVREFLANNGDRFEINGVDLSRAVFLYRMKNTSFEPIPKGNYSTKEESNILYLKVDDVIKAKAYEYQIIYVSEMKAGKYVETYPELKVLVSKYNDLVEDVTNIIKYAKTTGVKVDTLKMTQILTPLEPNTFWAMNKDGIIETYPLGDLNSKYEQMVSTLKKEVDELIKTTKETSLSEIEVAAKNKISEFTEELKKKVDELDIIFNKVQEDIKNSVDRLNNNEKEAIKEFERILAEKINSLNTLTDSLKNNLSNAVAKYIVDNRDKLKGDRGAGITSITAIQDKVTVNYDDNKNTVFIVPTVAGRDGKEIQNLSYTNNKLKITMSDNSSKEVEIKSGLTLKIVFKGSLRAGGKINLGENWKICFVNSAYNNHIETIINTGNEIHGSMPEGYLYSTYGIKNNEFIFDGNVNADGEIQQITILE